MFLRRYFLPFARGLSSQTLKKEQIFFEPVVQDILKRMSGKDYDKVFRRRRLGLTPSRPIYQFMTSDELEEARKEIDVKATEKLASPPVMDEREPKSQLLESDNQLFGFDTAKYVFTDITFGVPDRSRIIVVREPEGDLRTASWEEQDRINQVYYPKEGRKHYVPAMFEPENLEGLLTAERYQYILDRNCLQFEPDHPIYLKTADVVYNHILEKGSFDVLHSTRHYGPMVFNFCWSKQLDEFVIHLILKDRMKEVEDLIHLYVKIHQGCTLGEKLSQESPNPYSPEELVSLFAELESAKRGKVSMALDRWREQKKRFQDTQAGHGI